MTQNRTSRAATRLPQPKPKKAAGRPVLLSFLLLLGLLVAGYSAWWFSPYVVAWHWSAQLDDAEEAELAARAESLAGLGIAGAGPLVEKMDCPREAVSQAAVDALLRELRLRGKDQMYVLALLQQLEQQGPGFELKQQVQAAEIVQRIARTSAARPSSVARRCEQLLTSWQVAGVPSVADAPADRTAQRPSRPISPHLEGPFDVAVQPESILADDENSQPYRTEPRGLPMPADKDVGPIPLTAPQELELDDKTGMPLVRPPSQSPRIDLPEAVRRTAAENSATVPPEAIVNLREDALLRKLIDPALGHLAEAELRRRSFGDKQINLARSLQLSPNRYKLAQSLPSITYIEPAAWLLWLSNDPDPHMRRVALGLMATSGDEKLLSEVRRHAESDADQAVRELAGQLTGDFERR